MGETGAKRRNFGANEAVELSCSQNVRYFLNLLGSSLIISIDRNDRRPVIPLGHGDPSPFPSFGTDPAAVEDVCDALGSALFNLYSTTSGLPLARK